jgi:predicted DNA-binding transcriptional regulator YafY
VIHLGKKITNSMRLLKVREILFRETDEVTEMSIDKIIDRLREEFGDEYEVDRKAVKSDFKTLNSLRFEVQENASKYGKKYYSHKYKQFEQYELRMMINAIISARFITFKEAERLIEKIKGLTSVKMARNLPNPNQFESSIRGTYPQLRFEIDQMNTAISEQKQISFQYGKYNIEKDFVLNRSGAFYKVSPYALIWKNDYYYLIGILEGEDNFRNFRVDRMRNVKRIDKSFVKNSIDISEYVNESFNMYAGKSGWIKIKFKQSLVNVMIDYFGVTCDMRKLDEDFGVLSVRANRNEGLIRWLLTWGSDVIVMEPQDLVEEMKNEIRKMNEIYDGK